MARGNGTVSTESDILNGEPCNYASRFEGTPGVSLEELLAAALGGCYNQALANSVVLSAFKIEHVDIIFTASIIIQGPHGNLAVQAILIKVEAKVPVMLREKFEVSAQRARVHCSLLERLKIDPQLSTFLTAWMLLAEQLRATFRSKPWTQNFLEVVCPFTKAFELTEHGVGKLMRCFLIIDN